MTDWMFYKNDPMKKKWWSFKNYVIWVLWIFCLLILYTQMEHDKLETQVFCKISSYKMCGYTRLWIATDSEDTILWFGTSDKPMLDDQGFQAGCDDLVYRVTSTDVTIEKNNELIGFVEVGKKLPVYFLNLLNGSINPYWRTYEHLNKFLE